MSNVKELEAKIIAQQARIEQLANALSRFRDNVLFRIGSASPYRDIAQEYFDHIKGLLETTDDLSALRAHDEKLLKIIKQKDEAILQGNLSLALSYSPDTIDDLSALRAHDAKLLAPYQWQPIETAPKGELIAIWIVGTNKNGQKWSDEEGECWLYCYHDNICGDWRTTRPSGHLRCVPDRFVTHWMPLPRQRLMGMKNEP